MSKLDKNIAIAAGALAVGAIAVVGAGALVATDALDDDNSSSTDAQSALAPPPASGDGATTPVMTPATEPESGCRLDISRSVISPAEIAVDQLATAGIEFRAIRPGIQAGNSVALQVKSDYRVACEGTSGIIGHRGGFRLTRGQRWIEFRRFRVDIAAGVSKVFLSSTGMRGFNGGAIDLTRAERIDGDNGEVTIRAPFTLTREGAIALNAALGVHFFGPGAVLADLTLTARESV